MRTSARNTFTGEIIKITINPIINEVTLKTASGYVISSTITNSSRVELDITEGNTVKAYVKATNIMIAPHMQPYSACTANAFAGTITKVVSDGVVTEVSGILEDDTPVCALVTGGSFNAIAIGEGDPFIFMFNAMSVILF